MPLAGTISQSLDWASLKQERASLHPYSLIANYLPVLGLGLIEAHFRACKFSLDGAYLPVLGLGLIEATIEST